jgi:hypothetical protein
MVFTLINVPKASVEKVMGLQDEISTVIKKIGKVNTPEDYERVSKQLLHPYTEKFREAGVEEIIVEFPRVSAKQYKFGQKEKII